MKLQFFWLLNTHSKNWILIKQFIYELANLFLVCSLSSKAKHLLRVVCKEVNGKREAPKFYFCCQEVFQDQNICPLLQDFIQKDCFVYILGLSENWFCLALLFFRVSCNFIIILKILVEFSGLLNLVELYLRTQCCQ
jgi:hypothetical protein